MHTSHPAYRQAFDAYLRWGTPIDLTLKQAEPLTTTTAAAAVAAVATSTHYVWRTRGDGRVRPSHAANNGKIFAWNNPPPTGHPGEDYGCRCIAETVSLDAPQFRVIDVSHEFLPWSESSHRWGDLDFVLHFYFGRGQSVTLSQIGHLSEIVEAWAIGHGAMARWTDQIFEAALEQRTGRVDSEFGRPYDFKPVQYSHGHSVVSGQFRGRSTIQGRHMHLQGETNFAFSDEFTDPASIRQGIREILENSRSRADLVKEFRAAWRESAFWGKQDIDGMIDVLRDFSYGFTELLGTEYKVYGSWKSKIDARIEI